MNLFTNEMKRNPNQPRRFASALLIATAITSVGTFASTVSAQSAWTETEKLLASDGDSLDSFSYDVALNGMYSLIGAPGESNSEGAAYLYNINTGAELRKFKSSSHEREYFGKSVALNDKLVLIGAQQSSGAFMYSGAAYLFDLHTGQQLHKFTANDPAERALFGNEVALHGNHAIISAYGADNYAGAVYIFDLNTGQQLNKLTANDASINDQFGNVIAVDGDQILIGAPGADDQGTYAGAVYLFDLNTKQQLTRVTAPDGHEYHGFGSAVALEGNRALIGAYLDSDSEQGAGAAYLFDLDDGNQIFKLTANNGIRGAFFGKAVDFEGDTAIIGANFDRERGSYAGAAFIFDLKTGTQRQKMHPSDVGDNDGKQFGGNVAIQGNQLVIGAFADSENGIHTGSAYIFSINEFTVTPNPMIAGQNATFDATSLNPNQTAYLIYSTDGLGKKYIPLLDVTIDLLNPQMAGKARKADANGQADWTLPIPARQNGLDLWLQVVQRQHVTNYVETRID